MDNLYSKFRHDIYRELIIELDSSGIVKTISPNGRNILGYDIDEIVGLSIFNFIVDGNIKLDKVFEENQEIVLRSKSGENKYFDAVTNLIFNQDHEENGVLISLIDKGRLQGARMEDRKLLNILESSKDIIYMVQQRPEVKFLYLNSITKEIMGKDIEDYYKNPMIPFELTHPDDRELFFKKMKGEIDYSRPIQARYKNANGEYMWLEESIIPIYNEDKEVAVLIGFCRDIQERKELEEELKKISYYDSLTGIRNRAYFQKEIDNLHTETDEEIGIIICDLDNLKLINDNLGHLQGDKLLKDFGKIIGDFSSENIVTARTGGDEFVILIKGQSYDFLEDIYLKLLKSIESYNSSNMEPSIKVSIGIDYSQTSIGNTQRVYNVADRKMYENKLANKDAFTSKN